MRTLTRLSVAVLTALSLHDVRAGGKPMVANRFREPIPVPRKNRKFKPSRVSHRGRGH